MKLKNILNIISHAGILALAVTSVHATTWTWNGAAADGVFTDPGNWDVNGVMPTGVTNVSSRFNVSNGANSPCTYGVAQGDTAIVGGSGARALVIGSGSEGDFVITGGTFESRQGTVADILGNGAGFGTLTISGGIFLDTNNASGSFVNQLCLPLAENDGVTNQSVLTVNSGYAAISTISFSFSNGTGSTNVGGALVNLNGGTLAVDDYISYGTNFPCIQNFNGGTFQALASGTIIPGTFSTLNVLFGGAVIDSQAFNITIVPPLLNGGALLNGAASDGGVKKYGTGTLTLQGANTYNGPTIVNAGTLEIVQGSFSAISTVTVAANATLKLDAAQTHTVAGLILNGVSQPAGVYNSSTSPAYLSGAGSLQVVPPVSPTTWTWTGNANNGVFNNSGNWDVDGVMPTGITNGGGRLNVYNGVNGPCTYGAAQGDTVITNGGSKRCLVIGSGAKGDLVITGGTLECQDGTVANIIGNGSGPGTLTISGGTFIDTNNASGSDFVNQLCLPLSENAGLTNQNILTVNSGYAAISTISFSFANGTGSTDVGGAVVNLNGGTLAVNNYISYGTAFPCTNNFNGGTFQALASGTIIPGTFSTLNVLSGGAVIDSQSFNITIVPPLLNGAVADGGVTKYGSGTLTLQGANTYNGPTIVNAGTLEIVQGFFATNSTVTVANNAMLQLDSSQTYTVAGLILNGVSQPVGVYNSGTSPAYLSGSGNLLVNSQIATNPTNIMFEVSGNTLNLSWPADHLGWLVQSNAVNLAVSADWQDIPSTAAGTNYSIAINAKLPNVFYRLRHP